MIVIISIIIGIIIPLAYVAYKIYKKCEKCKYCDLIPKKNDNISFDDAYNTLFTEANPWFASFDIYKKKSEIKNDKL